jgi:hypothetical protein
MSDFVFEPRPAVRRNVPALVGLSGPSGAGKTYSSLLLARGLVGPEGKVLLLDTEARADLYADDPAVGRFYRQALEPPYSSDRYRQAMRAAIAWGADCIIVDSASHEHEGEGGLLDFADAEEARLRAAGGGAAKAAPRNKWIRPKADHNRWMNAVRGAPCHVILTIREKVVVDMEAKPPKKIQVPAVGQDLVFELMLHGRLRQPRPPEEFAGQDDPEAFRVQWQKLPRPLVGAVTQGERINVAAGERLAAALNGGQPSADPQLERFLSDAEERARECGLAELERWWKAQPAELRNRAAPHKARLGQLARMHDAEFEAEAPEAGADQEADG